MHNTLSLAHHPVYFAVAVAAAIIVYGNVAWTYTYIIREKEGFISKTLFFWNRLADNTTGWTRLFAGVVWPISLAISILCWFVWLTFGGIVRTFVGKDLDGKPLKQTPTTP